MVSLDIMLLQLRTPFFGRFTFQICKYVSESGSLENALPLPTLINILLLQVSIKLCVCSIYFSVFSAPPRRSTHVSSDMMVMGKKRLFSGFILGPMVCSGLLPAPLAWLVLFSPCAAVYR